MSRDEPNYAAHFSRKPCRGSGCQFDVIEPAGSSGPTPASEQAVDGNFAHLARIEIELHLGPVVVSNQWLGGAPDRVL